MRMTSSAGSDPSRQIQDLGGPDRHPACTFVRSSTGPPLEAPLRPSVVLDDVAVGSIEQILVSVEFVAKQAPPECQLHLVLSCSGLLPTLQAALPILILLTP